MKMTKMIGVFLIDARNVFNEGNRKIMVCVARNEWLSGSVFLTCADITLCWSQEVKRCQKPYFHIVEKG